MTKIIINPLSSKFRSHLLVTISTDFMTIKQSTRY